MCYFHNVYFIIWVVFWQEVPNAIDEGGREQ